MEYREEEQILLHEELCCNSTKEERLTKSNTLFKENLKLAYYVAKKFYSPSDNAISKEDILQEAYLGLWTACLRFEESKGFKFSTYAVPYIKGYVLRSIRESRPLKLPRKYKDIYSEISKRGFTIPLTEEEIDKLVEEGKFSRKQVIDCINIKVSSLDTPVPNTDETLTYGEVIPDKEDFTSEFSEDEIEEIIDQILTYVNPSHQDLVEEWLYSVVAGNSVPQRVLAKKYNISQSYVSRIIDSTIDILNRRSKNIRGLFGL